MERFEFKKIVKKLKIAYQKFEFFTKTDEIELWYEMLGGLDYKILNHAADNYIKNSQYQPTIADLYKRYRDIDDYIKMKNGELSELLDATRARYPEAIMTDMLMKEWDSIVREPKTWSERLAKAEEIRNRTWRYVENAERNGTIDSIPPFDEYMKELANELRG